MSLSLNDYVPSLSKLDEQMSNNTDSPNEYVNDWMASAIPVNSAVALSAAAAAGIIADDEVSSASLKISSPQSPESITASEASDLGHAMEIEKNGRKNVLYFDDNISEASENRSDASERINGNYENGQVSPEIGTIVGLRSRPLEGHGSSQSLFRW